VVDVSVVVVSAKVVVVGPPGKHLAHRTGNCRRTARACPGGGRRRAPSPSARSAARRGRSRARRTTSYRGTARHGGVQANRLLESLENAIALVQEHGGLADAELRDDVRRQDLLGPRLCACSCRHVDRRAKQVPVVLHGLAGTEPSADADRNAAMKP
jgi:hypothetical protein